MEDIKKAIEEELELYQNTRYNIFTEEEKIIASAEFRNGALFTLFKWQESERWRKVEEELEVGSNIIMRQKTEYGMHYSLFTNITQQIIDIVTKEYDDWKPIH